MGYSPWGSLRDTTERLTLTRLNLSNSRRAGCGQDMVCKGRPHGSWATLAMTQHCGARPGSCRLHCGRPTQAGPWARRLAGCRRHVGTQEPPGRTASESTEPLEGRPKACEQGPTPSPETASHWPEQETPPLSRPPRASPAAQHPPPLAGPEAPPLGVTPNTAPGSS